MAKVFIVDIDGVVADSRHRSRHLNVAHERDVDWRAWEADIALDTPIQPLIDLVNAMRGSHVIVFPTSRNQTCFNQTYDWLRQNGVAQVGDRILMRRDGDLRPSPEVKREHVATLRSFGANVVLAIDDHSANAAMYREEGIITLHVADY